MLGIPEKQFINIKMAVKYLLNRNHILQGNKSVYMTSEIIYFSVTSLIILSMSREVPYIKVSSQLLFLQWPIRLTYNQWQVQKHIEMLSLTLNDLWYQHWRVVILVYIYQNLNILKRDLDDFTTKKAVAGLRPLNWGSLFPNCCH